MKTWHVYAVERNPRGSHPKVGMVHQSWARRPYIDPRFAESLTQVTMYPWWALTFASAREAREFVAFFLPPQLRDPRWTFVVSDLTPAELSTARAIRREERESRKARTV